MVANKSLILVGPGEHFGLELARLFGSENFHIVLIARNPSSLIGASNELEQENISCSCLAVDITDKDKFSNQLAEIAKSIPPIEALIFNVVASSRGNGLNLPPDELTRALTTNVSGALAVVQAALPFLVKGSSIVFTGGGYKDAPDSEKLALSVSKGALHTLFLSLVQPLQTQGIKIGTVVIDGAVREDGPIYPRDVAKAFWDVYQAETGKIVELR